MEALVERVGSAPDSQVESNAWRGDGAPAKARRPSTTSGPLHPLNRTVNFLLALLALIALMPVLLLIALAIKLTSRGPVLYTQERVGLDRRAGARDAAHPRRRRDLGGQPFTIYKFRTMRVDAERESGAVWAAQNDPRVTPVGRLLRQYRLDEIPQLLNVLRGEMNIVGPRPERPTIFAELREHIAEYPLRQRAKPGITGLAQINHHYDRSLDDVRTKVSFDLEYIRRQSLREDVRIMLKTLPVVLFRRGGW
jgi:lipopolysaccharide/colanic/teichoic acid biosynthesis glycosyltransferase